MGEGRGGGEGTQKGSLRLTDGLYGSFVCLVGILSIFALSIL